MNISGLDSLIPVNESATLSSKGEKLTPEQMKLKSTCNEFEAVMVSMIIKEGMAGAEEMGKISGTQEQTDSGSKTFKDMAMEQMSYHVGKTGLMGLGDMLYESMKSRLEGGETK